MNYLKHSKHCVYFLLFFMLIVQCDNTVKISKVDDNNEIDSTTYEPTPQQREVELLLEQNEGSTISTDGDVINSEGTIIYTRTPEDIFENKVNEVMSEANTLQTIFTQLFPDEITQAIAGLRDTTTEYDLPEFTLLTFSKTMKLREIWRFLNAGNDIETSLYYDSNEFANIADNGIVGGFTGYITKNIEALKTEQNNLEQNKNDEVKRQASLKTIKHQLRAIVGSKEDANGLIPMLVVIESIDEFYIRIIAKIDAFKELNENYRDEANNSLKTNPESEKQQNKKVMAEESLVLVETLRSIYKNIKDSIDAVKTKITTYKNTFEEMMTTHPLKDVE